MVWRWNGSSGSGFRFRRFLCKKGFSVFQYSLTGKDGSGFGSWKTVPAVPVPLSVSGKTVPMVPVSGSGSVPEPPHKVKAQNESPEPYNQRTPWGVEKKRGGKTSRWTPLPKRVLDPLSSGTASTPLRCRWSAFPVQKSKTQHYRGSFGGVQNFSAGGVVWHVFLPPYVLHPPISGPNTSQKKRAQQVSI